MVIQNSAPSGRCDKSDFSIISTSAFTAPGLEHPAVSMELAGVFLSPLNTVWLILDPAFSLILCVRRKMLYQREGSCSSCTENFSSSKVSIIQCTLGSVVTTL